MADPSTPRAPRGGVPTDQTVPTATLLGPLALFVLLGIPLVALVWDALNRLVAGEVHGGRLLAGLVALVLWLVLLRALARRLTDWHGREADRPAARRSESDRGARSTARNLDDA
jgi:hypothetical protein